jgi:hypothetical protein
MRMHRNAPAADEGDGREKNPEGGHGFRASGGIYARLFGKKQMIS